LESGISLLAGAPQQRLLQLVGKDRFVAAFKKAVAQGWGVTFIESGDVPFEPFSGGFWVA
jgi:hypothetical protein